MQDDDIKIYRMQPNDMFMQISVLLYLSILMESNSSW